MPDNNNELRNDEIRNIVEEVIRYMEGTAWVDRQRHYHDHQLIQELREQKDYDDMRRDYIDRCIAKEQKQAHDRRITRRTIVGGTFVTGMVALLDELVAMCSDVITWVIKLFSGQ